MKLAIIYGTRPEFLKLKCLIDLLQDKIKLLVIKVEQHIDLKEDIGYYDQVLSIDNISIDRINNIGINILTKLPNLIKDVSHLLAQGDTATVFYSLLCGFQLKKKCIHLEAGLRTYDLDNPYPEEGYRQMISRITDIHLCPSQLEAEILRQEKCNGEIYIIGNTILDLVESYKYPISDNNKVLITLHRRENWGDFKNYMLKLINMIDKNSQLKFYFLTHPNPILSDILTELKDIIPQNMIISKSLHHKDLIKLLSECSFVITDSGGIQEEANFLGKHIYLLRKKTERQSINMEKITFCNFGNIDQIEFRKFDHKKGLEYGDGKSCEYIYDIIIKLIS